ncbi:MAG: AraC family transcriptional regulator [Burkholderiaceae bacterium]
MATMIRSASLTGYAQIARSAGLDPIAMMREAGLDPGCLRTPDTRISVAAVRRLLENTASAGGIDDIGLRMVESRRLSNLGPISLLLREQPTAREALNVLMRHMRALNESLITRVEEEGGFVIIREEFALGRSIRVRQGIELAIGVMFRILQELMGPEWEPRQVCFTHPPPANRSSHLRVFGRFVEFGCEFNGIVCLARDLEVRNPSADPVMAAYAQRYLDTFFSSSELSTTEKVHRLVRLLLPGGRCTIDIVARHLGMDRRTIHRHLGRDATSFSSVLQQGRAELSVQFLQDPKRPLGEVADALGFSSVSALSRWFRTEFGRTITEWRREHPAR